MSSVEQPGTVKRSPLFGVSRTRIKALDDGVRKTIENTIQRWTRNRIEFLQSLPEVTQQELADEGLLQAPDVAVKPAAAQRAPAAQQRHQSPAFPAPPQRSRL